MRIQQVVVLAIASLAVLAAVPSAQAQARGFHGGAAVHSGAPIRGGAPAHVGPGFNYGRGYGVGRGYDYDRGYGYGRGWGYGPGWGWRGPWIAPYPYYTYPGPVYGPPSAYTTQVPVQQWNGYGYVTVYRTVIVYFDYNTGRSYYVLDGRTYWLQ